MRETLVSLQDTQDQLVASARINALGKMAAGVAHDFNNILNGVLGRTQILLRALAKGEPDLAKAQTGLRTIETLALQGAEAVRRLQEFSRIRKDRSEESSDLTDAVQRAVELTRPKWQEEPAAAGRQVDVTLQLAPVPPVVGGTNELCQVISNLIFNAVEAMPEGGSLALRTYLDENQVCLEVADTGVGMNEETRNRLFEPFYTTKATGHGLGTSVVYGIITRLGGSIHVQSEPGQGSAITLKLPRGQASLGAAARRGPGAATLPLPLRVLLVDDQEHNLAFYRDALEQYGVEVHDRRLGGRRRGRPRRRSVRRRHHGSGHARHVRLGREPGEQDQVSPNARRPAERLGGAAGGRPDRRLRRGPGPGETDRDCGSAARANARFCRRGPAATTPARQRRRRRKSRPFERDRGLENAQGHGPRAAEVGRPASGRIHSPARVEERPPGGGRKRKGTPMSTTSLLRSGNRVMVRGLVFVCLSVLFLPAVAHAADNQAVGNVAGVDADLDDSNVFTINAAVLALVKAAFLTDGTALTSGATVPRGTLVKFLIYMDNTTSVAADNVNISDTLNAAFVYQAGTIKIDSSQNTGATPAAIYAAVNAAAAVTDAVSGADVAGINGTVVSAGAGAGNANLNAPASRVWAMLFTARVQ